MSLSSSLDDINTRFGEPAKKRLKVDTDNCKTCKITDLPDDCLNRVYQSLESRTDHTSFSLVCHHWLHIRLQHLKFLSITSQSEFSGLQVLFQCLNGRFKHSDIKPSLIFSWFPHLTTVRLIDTCITDEGLKVLAKCSASLEKADLTKSQGITDSGISFLIKNCSKLQSLAITDCWSVTGIGFLGCPNTLTHVEAEGKYNKLTARGIKAIVSGGGLKSLYLSGNEVTDESVMTISKSCPLLKVLQLKSCHEVQLEGWRAIGLHCRNLKVLYVADCPKFCSLSLEALRNGRTRLSFLFIDRLAVFAFDLFQRERPNVHVFNTTSDNGG